MRKILILFLLAIPLFAQQQVQPVAGVLTLNIVPGTTVFKVILSANVTSVVIQNATPGTIISVIFTENATGGFAVAFGGNIANPCAVSAIANATTTCQFQYDATSNTWNGINGGGGGGGITVANITTSGAVSGKGVADGAMATTSSTFSANGSSTSPATPSGMTTFNNELVVSMYSLNAAFTPPGTPTARVNVPVAGGTNEGLWIGDQTVASAGAYAANTGTVSSSSWAAAAIPLIPKSGQTISFTSSASNHATGTLVTVTFASTAGQVLIACVAGFNGFSAIMPSNWATIVGNQNGGSQFLTCGIHQAGASEPGSYTFSGLGTFIAAGIVEYSNVAAIDNTLTSATANWSAANVGQTICAEGLISSALASGFLSCGPLNLVSNATTVYPLFTNTQSSSVTTSTLEFGPDSTSSFTTALTALGSLGGTIYVPPGIFFLTAGQLKLPYNITVNISGSGAQATIGNGTPNNAAGGSFIIGIPDGANDPIIGFTVCSSCATQIYQTNDVIQGITIRSNRTGGDCIDVGMEFVTVQNSDLIGCGNDGIKFVLNNTVYSGLNVVKHNLIEFVNNYGVDIQTGTTGSNYVIEGNEMDFDGNAGAGGAIQVGGAQQVTIINNQLQFGGAAVTVTSTGSVPVAIGPGNWIDGSITYTASGGPGPDIFDNFFELANLINFNGQVGPKVTGNNFFAAAPFNAASTQKNLTMDATNINAGMTTSFSGTSGTASCAFSLAGGQARATCFLNGYAETGTAQTWTYPLAMATTPFLTESGGSCGAQNPSTNATVLTLPANAAMSAETCQIIVEGQTN